MVVQNPRAVINAEIMTSGHTVTAYVYADVQCYYAAILVMLLGLGTDIFRISRLAAVLTRHGDRFLRRAYHPDEIAAFRTYASERRGTEFLAARFKAFVTTAKMTNRSSDGRSRNPPTKR